MNYLQSYDEDGPLIHPLTYKMHVFNDPLGYRRNHRHDFEIELMKAYSLEYNIKATTNGGFVLEEERYNSSSFNIKTLFNIIDNTKAAAEERYDNLDSELILTVEVSLKNVFVFLDEDKKPFYNHCVSVFQLPGHWHFNETSERNTLEPTLIYEIYNNTELLHSMRNGFKPLQAKIKQLIKADCVKHLRKKSL